jgi:hypothetical protein
MRDGQAACYFPRDVFLRLLTFRLGIGLPSVETGGTATCFDFLGVADI